MSSHSHSSSFFKFKKELLGNIWSSDVRSDIVSGAVVSKKHIFVGTQIGRLVALYPNGEIAWVFDCKEDMSAKEELFLDTESSFGITAPISYDDQAVYITTEAGSIFAVNHDGHFLWHTKIDGAIRGSVCITKNTDDQKELIVASTNQEVYILQENGKIKRAIKLHASPQTTPAVHEDMIIVGCSDGKILAFTSEGRKKWSFETKGQITAKPLISQLYNDSETVILVASHDNNLYALTPLGELKWKFETKGSLVSHPTTVHLSSGQGKDILIGSCDNNLYCISAHGELVWSYETDFWVTAPPLVLDTNKLTAIIVGSYDEQVYLLDGNGDFNLNYMPGLTGIINQTGYASLLSSRDVGENKGKLLEKYPAQGHIVGCSYFQDEDHIIVTTKQGVIYGFHIQ